MSASNQMLTDEEVRQNESKAQAILQEYDKEAGYRVFDKKWIGLLVSVIAICFALYHLYAAYAIPFVTLKHRSLHVAVVLCLIYLLYPGWKKASRKKLSLLDVVLALASLGTAGYIFIYYLDIVNRGGIPSTLDVTFATITCLLVLEASRRVAGWELTAMASIFVAYAYLGPYLPGDFAHRGYTFSDIFNYMYVTTEGIFGDATAVSASFIILFIIFGAFLSKSGMGTLFNDLSLALAGSSKGGPAKVGVIASAVHGSINGSAVASVVTTGSFTIPMMKRVGYKPDFAAGVEATAAVGGQILPPIMGAAAFIMAETLGVPYITIAVAALIPAIMYYFGLLVQVHLRADRDNLQGLTKEELPKVKDVLKERGHLLLPLILLVVLLMMGYTPTLVAVATIIATIVIAALRPSSRMGFRDVLQALETGVRDTLGVAAACAAVGITVGVFSLTGLGLKLASIILMMGSGSLFMTLLFTMIASIILGLGLPSIPCYIITATMAAPALSTFGVDPLAAHLFVFYFGAIANLTPPIALAAFAGAGIAGSDPQRTGWISCKLALAGFIVPFIFIYKPGLLILESSVADIAFAALATLLAVLALAAATEGFLFAKMNWIFRLALIAAGILLIFPEAILMGSGLGIMIAISVLQFMKKRNGIKTIEV
ncbi:TRAP transporter permease [Brevibacillus borstelensis]|uniref:TRAP transporter permease n=1 Tax=Brevibacillus borstelensis TaxID=45462 RepID=UPI0004F32EA2|nr:TRAP transporter permease [Brevibacillus borstelensis]KKX54632.1 C4-dicarboxylate ABC transporter permease [Brevibacillus borstelensis cifa_chp40]MED1746784.1 TRAP transporter permease [Brevibacillus borstelensis]MED1852849.1 TRAP transporter permease [Brevibacillus borstelensis]MED1873743.1 TRAP transporter permease [Brevibacillus borstelensis]